MVAVIEQEEQSEQMAFEFRNIDVRLTSIESTLPYLATKVDLIRVESKIEKLEAKMDSKMAVLVANMDTKMAAMESGMIRTESTMIKWFAGAVVAIITSNVAIAAIVLSMVKRHLN